MAVGARGVSSLSVPRRVGEGSRPGSGLAPIPHPDMADWPVQGNLTTPYIAMIIIVQVISKSIPAPPPLSLSHIFCFLN